MSEMTELQRANFSFNVTVVVVVSYLFCLLLAAIISQFKHRKLIDVLVFPLFGPLGVLIMAILPARPFEKVDLRKVGLSRAQKVALDRQDRRNKDKDKFTYVKRDPSVPLPSQLTLTESEKQRIRKSGPPRIL